MIALLVENNADVNARNDREETPCDVLKDNGEKDLTGMMRADFVYEIRKERAFPHFSNRIDIRTLLKC